MQGWAATGDLNVARSGHTATLLADGQVLAVGGIEGSGAQYTLLSSAELYDPKAGTWTQTASTFYERIGHTATLLANGRVLIVGGTQNTNTEVYNPATGEWYATGRLNAARPSGHAATRLIDGRVLVVGGYDQTIPFPDCFLSSAEIYDPEKQVWTFTGSLNNGRYGLTATLLADGNRNLRSRLGGVDAHSKPILQSIWSHGHTFGRRQSTRGGRAYIYPYAQSP